MEEICPGRPSSIDCRIKFIGWLASFDMGRADEEPRVVKIHDLALPDKRKEGSESTWVIRNTVTKPSLPAHLSSVSVSRASLASRHV